MSDPKESERPLLLKDLIRQVLTELTEAVKERDLFQLATGFVSEFNLPFGKNGLRKASAKS